MEFIGIFKFRWIIITLEKERSLNPLPNGIGTHRQTVNYDLYATTKVILIE